MIKLRYSIFIILICFSAKSQENFNNIDLMLLEKAPVTTHSSMNAMVLSITANSKVVKERAQSRD